MVANRKVTGKALSMPGGIMIGTGTAIVITVLGTALFAWLINGAYLPETAVGYGAMLILLIASAIGAWVASGLVKRQRLLACLITGCAYLILLLGITAFFFGGQYQGVIPTALLIAGGSTAAALLDNLGQGNRTSVRHKRVYG